MKADFNYDVTDAQLITNLSGSCFQLRFQTVDQPSTGPQRSGKYIHLSMTPTQAMHLLAQLHAAQQKHKLAVLADVQLTTVPPAKDRN